LPRILDYIHFGLVKTRMVSVAEVMPRVALVYQVIGIYNFKDQ